jgi:hypothetical protein
MSHRTRFRGWPPCDACGDAVHPDEGLLSLDTQLARKRFRGQQLWEEEYHVDSSEPQPTSLRMLMSMPDSPDWWWGHDRCSPPENDYEVEADRFDDIGKVLDWTLHLMHKNWFDAVSWERAVRRLYELPDA